MFRSFQIQLSCYPVILQLFQLSSGSFGEKVTNFRENILVSLMFIKMAMATIMNWPRTMSLCYISFQKNFLSSHHLCLPSKVLELLLLLRHQLLSKELWLGCIMICCQAVISASFVPAFPTRHGFFYLGSGLPPHFDPYSLGHFNVSF